MEQNLHASKFYYNKNNNEHLLSIYCVILLKLYNNPYKGVMILGSQAKQFKVQKVE